MILVAFDFDHTLIDGNSDTHVLRLLPNRQVPDDIKALYRKDGWTKYMGAIFGLLHRNGVTSGDVMGSLGDLPWAPGMPDLLRLLEAHRDDYETIIISDSNSLFIDRMLSDKSLKQAVHAVYTNPAFVDVTDCIKVEYYHTQDWCPLSTVNLCKGSILTSHIATRKEAGVTFKRVVYIGDGGNDFCPTLELSSRDTVCARKGFGLSKKIDAYDDHSRPLVAKVFPWESGQEIADMLELPR